MTRGSQSQGFWSNWICGPLRMAVYANENLLMSKFLKNMIRQSSLCPSHYIAKRLIASSYDLVSSKWLLQSYFWHVFVILWWNYCTIPAVYDSHVCLEQMSIPSTQTLLIVYAHPDQTRKTNCLLARDPKQWLKGERNTSLPERITVESHLALSQ